MYRSPDQNTPQYRNIKSENMLFENASNLNYLETTVHRSKLHSRRTLQQIKSGYVRYHSVRNTSSSLLLYRN